MNVFFSTTKIISKIKIEKRIYVENKIKILSLTYVVNFLFQRHLPEYSRRCGFNIFHIKIY